MNIAPATAPAPLTSPRANQSPAALRRAAQEFEAQALAALLQPMFQARLVEQNGTWVPELIEIVDADTVAPPVAG